MDPLDNGLISFPVYGIPQTKGSAKGFPIADKATGKLRVVITNDNTKNKPWSETVRLAAQQARREGCPYQGPVGLKLYFYLLPPKSIPKTRLSYATKKPDLDKMVRSVKDALKGVLYRDDSQVVDCHTFKVYATEPGVCIVVENLDGRESYGYQPSKKEARV